MAIWLRGLKRWYLVLGGVAVDRGFDPQSDLELFSVKILTFKERKIFLPEKIIISRAGFENGSPDLMLAIFNHYTTGPLDTSAE
jgi:hypothetical protein